MSNQIDSMIHRYVPFFKIASYLHFHVEAESRSPLLSSSQRTSVTSPFLNPMQITYAGRESHIALVPQDSNVSFFCGYWSKYGY